MRASCPRLFALILGQIARLLQHHLDRRQGNDLAGSAGIVDPLALNQPVAAWVSNPVPANSGASSVNWNAPASCKLVIV
ncbi:MAG: hypothetical protein ACPIOQ_55705, partial [Promethearchaeia archaeon]